MQREDLFHPLDYTSKLTLLMMSSLKSKSIFPKNIGTDTFTMNYFLLLWSLQLMVYRRLMFSGHIVRGIS